MEDEVDDAGIETAEDAVEDLPSDFFDEFSKDEFIEGLSIIDSWNDEDLRSEHMLIRSNERGNTKSVDQLPDYVVRKRQKGTKKKSARTPDSSRLDEVIKPGSRRDPKKTNQAIKKDKEEKVKEYLAKSLESSEDLRPPGTELDGFFENDKQKKKEEGLKNESPPLSRQRSRSRELRRDSTSKSGYRMRHSPVRSTLRPRWSPKRSPKRSPLGSHRYNSWQPKPKYSRGSYKRYSPLRRSPRRGSSFRSPHRGSPHRSPRRSRRSRSRSPYRPNYTSYRSRSKSPIIHTDKFLYPAEPNLLPHFGQDTTSVVYQPQYPVSTPADYTNTQSYPYAPIYAEAYNNGNQYGYNQSSGSLPSLPDPALPPILTPTENPGPVPPPSMVPAPAMVSPARQLRLSHQAEEKTPYDALAKLVAEGKISRADYLKLAPNKGHSSSMDNNHRVIVLNRCNEALNKLSKLHLPNYLLMNNNMMNMDTDIKYIAPKFCSPLKRQAPIEFQFTTPNVNIATQHNKNLVDSIIASLPELKKVITRPKKTAKNMKDAAVQTSKPYCDVCEIRENTQCRNFGTSIEREHFSSTVHTQVVEQDLINSKSVFNPSGSVADTSSMSIAHLTPAQLVSQLAARAKTLKPPEPASSNHNQYQRNHPNRYNYDYDGRGGNQYQNYNYKY